MLLFLLVEREGSRQSLRVQRGGVLQPTRPGYSPLDEKPWKVWICLPQLKAKIKQETLRLQQEWGRTSHKLKNRNLVLRPGLEPPRTLLSSLP